MAVVEAILAMIKEASPRLYVLDALVTFDGRDDSTPPVIKCLLCIVRPDATRPSGPPDAKLRVVMFLARRMRHGDV